MFVEFIRFIDVPVGAVFSTKKGLKLKKILQPSPHEYHSSLKFIRPNAVNLENGHKVCIGVLFECYDIEEPSDEKS